MKTRDWDFQSLFWPGSVSDLIGGRGRNHGECPESLQRWTPETDELLEWVLRQHKSRRCSTSRSGPRGSLHIKLVDKRSTRFRGGKVGSGTFSSGSWVPSVRIPPGWWNLCDKNSTRPEIVVNVEGKKDQGFFG